VCTYLYTPDGKGGVLDIVVHHSIQLSEVIVTDILDSDHLPVLVHILDSVRESEALDLVENFRGWERFQSFTSELIARS
jgi:hypothetical protein